MNPTRLLSALLLSVLALPALANPPRTLTIINWEEFLDPRVIQQFEKRENAKVVQLHFSTVEESLALARNNIGKADLLVGGMVVKDQLKAEGKVQPLTRGKLPNVKHSLPQFAADLDYVAPYVWGYTGIAWRTDKMKEAIDSYPKLLAYARRNPGKVALTDDAMEFAHAVMYMYGAPPYNHDDLNAVKAALAKYDAEGRKLFRIMPSAYDNNWPLTTGEVHAATVYNGDIKFHRDEFKAPLAFNNPAQGCFFWQENFMLLAKAPQPELAHRFLNYINEPRVAARNAEAVFYASSNPSAALHYGTEFLDNPIIRPKLEGTNNCRVNKPLSPATQKFIDGLKPYGLE